MQHRDGTQEEFIQSPVWQEEKEEKKRTGTFTFLRASTQRHKARGDEVVKVGASAAPDALFSIVETWSHTHTHIEPFTYIYTQIQSVGETDTDCVRILI